MEGDGVAGSSDIFFGNANDDLSRLGSTAPNGY